MKAMMLALVAVAGLLLVALAPRLAGILFAMMRDGAEYRPPKPQERKEAA